MGQVQQETINFLISAVDQHMENLMQDSVTPKEVAEAVSLLLGKYRAELANMKE